MNTLKAVVFDYGKVLSLPPTLEQWQQMSARLGKTPQELQQFYHDYRPDMDRGLDDYVAYWQKVGKDCGRQISAAEALELSDHDNWQWTNESPEMVRLARDLQRAGYKTAILSNMEKRMLAAMSEKLAWLDEFDVQIYSCEVGMVKPEAEIYRLVLPEAGLRAARGAVPGRQEGKHGGSEKSGDAEPRLPLGGGTGDADRRTGNHGAELRRCC